MINFIADVSHLIKEVELRNDPVVITVNEFTEESANEFAALVSAAQNTGQKVIPVIIDSYGGQAYSLLSMIGTIKSSSVPIATIIKGKAMSCGALLASFGEEGLRFMDRDSVLRDNRNRWHESLSKDIYMEEALNVLKDLLTRQNDLSLLRE